MILHLELKICCDTNYTFKTITQHDLIILCQRSEDLRKSLQPINPDVQITKGQLLMKQKQFQELQKIMWDFIQKDGAAEAVDSTTELGDAGSADRVAVPPGEIASCLSGEANNNVQSPKGVRDETPGSLGEEVLATDIDDSALDLWEVKLNQCKEEMPARSPDLPREEIISPGQEAASQTPTADFSSASRLSGSPPLGQQAQSSLSKRSPGSQGLSTTSIVDRQTSTDVSSQERESGVGEEAQSGYSTCVASPVCVLAETTAA